ncbi:hypothetical protein MRB53_020316 [Persea americana]|uniref:Uncharacterized protein n=1 Tax=Persea americana TaxID=3435 RepID=A0ACC2L0M4_PERAE|nr:hypothetical protein MRB53_020316 [Persea americana]
MTPTSGLASPPPHNPTSRTSSSPPSSAKRPRPSLKSSAIPSPSLPPLSSLTALGPNSFPSCSSSSTPTAPASKNPHSSSSPSYRNISAKT